MTYQELTEVCRGMKLPFCAKNDDGENVIVSRGLDFFEQQTAQHNGWIRINRVYRDGTREELYKR